MNYESPGPTRQEIALSSPDALAFVESRVSAWMEKAGPLIASYPEETRDLKVAELTLAQARFVLLDLAAEAVNKGEAGPDLRAIVGMGSTFSEASILDELEKMKAAGMSMPGTHAICEMLIARSRNDVREYAETTKEVFTDL